MNKILVLIGSLIVSIAAFSQQYNFTNYSIEEGLIQSQIRSISQDNSGYIWIGTLGGVSKFDGLNFENYSTNDGLLSNQVDAIYNDSKGNVWFGGQGGVSVYDGTEFKKYTFKDELSQRFVLSIAEDSKGKMWFASDGGGMICMDNLKFTYVVLPNGPDNNYVRNVVIDKHGNKWLATRNGVSIIDCNQNIKDTIKNVNATQIFVDSDNSIWCSTFGDGVFHLTEDTTVVLNQKSGLITNHIRRFAKRKDGSFWFVSKKGISKYKTGLIKNFTIDDGLPDDNIKAVVEDEEGNLFFGSDGSGLIKFTNDNFVSYTQEDGIVSNVVMSIIEDANSNIWLSTYGKGVTKIEGENYSSYTELDGLANNTVWCSMLASDNRIWFATDGGASVYDGKTFKTYRQKDGLGAKKIYALSEDEKGNIWIGTKEGLSVLDIKTDSINDYTDLVGLSRNVRYIYKENAHITWFCSSEGLSRYDSKKGKSEKFNTENGLPENSVMTIIKDGSDRFWIGTKNGIIIYSKGVFRTLKLPDNSASNNVNFIQLDTAENLWLGTNFGLYKLNIANKDTFVSTDFIRYTNIDGLKSLECNQNSAYIDDNNNLWFGTSYGLMKHKLNAENTNTSLPKVQIKDIRLFFEKKNLENFSSGFNKATKLPENLVLKHNKNHLTFDFVGVYHTSPNKVKYRFKLEGFDEVWHPVTKSTFVTYSNIPAGDFTFKLSATTDLKKWTKPVNFSFSIKPAFWFTWWFYLLCIILITGVVWLIIRVRVKKEAEKRSTQLIVDKSKMLELEQQALNSSMNRHFIFNALNSIQYYINRQDKISANKYLSSFAKLVRKNLDSSLVNEIYLEDEIERIGLYLKLEEMRFQEKFSYKINVDPNIEPQSVKIPSMLLQPFIENSIWHGILPRDKKGHIAVDINKVENKLIIKIVDDGIGIDTSLGIKKGKKQHHDSKGMDLTIGRINLISKVSKKECAIKGPYQIYNDKREIAGTEVSIVLTL